jgi:hypothetical protein
VIAFIIVSNVVDVVVRPLQHVKPLNPWRPA